MDSVSTLARAKTGDEQAFRELTEPYRAELHLIVLTLRGDRISAVSWFFDTSVFPHFGLSRAVPGRRDIGR
jgi:hypothetical protein